MMCQILVVLVAFFAGVGAVEAATSNPFEQGTQTPVLSQEERASLLEYADNSKAKLEQALQDAKGLPFSEIGEIYLGAIKKVVIESAVSKPRSELLMRYALNQALELTYGIPTADGRRIAQAGVLKGSANQNLLVAILENSIRLALSYYEDDRRAIQAGKLLDLPYAKLAQEHLEMARTKWLPAILEWGFQYNFSIAVLKQFMATVANEEEQRKAKFAEEIIAADSWLMDEKERWPESWEELHKRVRVLRKNLRVLVSKLQEKNQPPVVQAPVIPDTFFNHLEDTPVRVHYFNYSAVRFVANGTRIATHYEEGGAGSTRLWDLKGNLLARYGTEEWSGEAAMSPSGLKIATGLKHAPGQSECGGIFDLDGNKVASLNVNDEELSHFAFSPSSLLVAAAGKGDKVYLWDVTGKLLATFSGHESGHSKRVVFSPDGKTILTIDHTIVRGWDLEGRKLFTISGHEDYVTSANVSPDGTKVLTVSSGKVKLWDLNGNLLWSHDVTSSAAFTPDGKRVVTGISIFDEVYVYDVQGEFVVRFKTGSSTSIRLIDVSPDGTKLLLVDQASLLVWSPEAGK